MSYRGTEKEILLLKQSPFSWKPDQVLYCENTNLNCTFEQIEKMRSRGLLNYIDLFILKAMAKYKFLALSHINAYANNHMPLEKYKKDTYERNVAKMVRSGIIKKFYFAGSSSIHRSIRFYDLSRGGYSYVRDVLGDPVHHLNDVQRPERVMELLSLNQFDIGLMKSFKEKIQYRGYTETKRLGSTSAELDLYYRINDSVWSPPLNLYVLSIRRCENYSSTLLEKIRIVKSCVQCCEISGPVMVLVLCESMEALKSFVKFQEQNEDIKNEFILYTTDISNYVFGTMKSIMMCKHVAGEFITERLLLFESKS